MILPQNTIFYDLGSQTNNNLYQMRCLANHIHAFQVTSKQYLLIKISMVTIGNQDGVLHGYFSDTPMGQNVFYGNTNVSPFIIKKNYANNEAYTGNHGSIFRIYSNDYDFSNGVVVSAQSSNPVNMITSYITGPDPDKPSYTPVKQIIEVASRLILTPDKTYYVNLQNRQNKDLIYKLVFDVDTPCAQMPKECIKNYQVSDESNMYPHFRYPSNGQNGWS